MFIPKSSNFVVHSAVVYGHKHRSITNSRVNNFLDDGQWKDVNIQAVLYDLRVSGSPHINLEVWSAPGQDRPTFEHAVKQKFRPTHQGESFGPSWTTHWFHVTVQIPKEFAGKPVQFLFDSNSEAMIWSADGEPLQGITGGGGDERHVDYLLTRKATDNEGIREFYVEMAANDLFGNGDYHQHPQDRAIYYNLSTVELVAPNLDAWALYHDLEVIVEMAGRLPQDSARSWQALKAANAMVNVFDHRNIDTIAPAREIAEQFFSVNGAHTRHQVYAIGNCHIDTAWLWPFAETKRKSARSWATQLQLMDQYPEYKFAASQAQQFEWLKQNYPGLFARIQDKAKSGQFIPIGATWVEMDCNLPSGESLARQFLLGQQFYQEHFDETCKVFWLPDTFGYSSQLPQIYFFTQKLSWNNINRFPNTTFRHCRPGELIDSEHNHKDIVYTNESMLLYGNGDGGGGPLKAMLERLRRMADTDGLPRVKNAHPNEFYEHVEKTATELVSWKGELYFELHRGTYTSQSNNKRNNRQAEFLMRDVELLNTVAKASSFGLYDYPMEAIRKLWKQVCLNQFHDVLPGSAIGMVYRDSDKIYNEIFTIGDALRKRATDFLYGDVVAKAPEDMSAVLLVNTAAWMRTDIIAVPELPLSLLSKAGANVQIRRKDGAPLVLATNVCGNRAQLLDPAQTTEFHSSPVKVYQEGDDFVLENTMVKVTIGHNGRVKSFIDIREDRELVPEGAQGNVFELYDDVPLYWDAWDIEIYNLEKYQSLPGTDITMVDKGPLVASLIVRVPIGDTSVLVQTITLTAISPRLEFDCHIGWHENRKCLKVSFTWDIHSDVATYETQFGVVQRPTHRNTSWDMAKFEVCGHKFADLSEYGYGVALLNDCKYGYSTLENTMTLTLLRSPKAPDENCDMGPHVFRYAVFPHKGTFAESTVVKEAYNFNVPLLHLPANADRFSMKGGMAGAAHPYFSLSNAPNVVLDTVKAAEDGSSSFVVRMYEAYGGHAKALLTTALPAMKAEIVNILEGHVSDLEWLPHSKSTAIKFKPFEIVTVKFSI
ncbi:hypothetical protein DL89DRAFT_275108 [Linderina pennispora]|uniref:Alpha-mannosidase n=1 Tax=Linderina pennispora TaxID=61395 RepID=A0A1Y1W6B5_9FUNG|nr:uncharacterized protein DL89DRAFT_275108 [Linderina pennispora]ORX69069.1 hypothetical protein DL89DRAFT_275108 [Linderina pennispora]